MPPPGIELFPVVLTDHRSSTPQGEPSLFEQIFHGSPQPMWIYDSESLRFLAVNPAAQRYYGHTEAEFLRLTLYDIRPREHRAELDRILKLETDGSLEKQSTHLTKDGRILYVEILSNPVTYLGRKARYVVARDISARRKAEEQIVESNVILRSTIDSTLRGVLAIDRNGNPVLRSEQFDRLFAVPENMLPTGVGSLRDYLGGLVEDPNAFFELTERYRIPQLADHDGYLPLKDGRVIHVSIKPQILSGQPIGSVWSFQDITEQRRAVEALRTSEARFRNVIENLGEGLVITDTECRIVYANERLSRLTGFPNEELVGSLVYECLSPIEQKIAVKELLLERLEGTSESHETILSRNDGSELSAIIHATPYRDAEGAIIGTIGAITDISNRKRAEDQARASAAEAQMLATQLTTILENTSDTIFSIDRNYRVVRYNTRFAEVCRVFGGKARIGAHLEDLYPAGKIREEWFRHIERALAGERVTFEQRSSQRGAWWWSEISMNPVFRQTDAGTTVVDGVVTFGKNISGRKRTELDLVHSRLSLKALIDNADDLIFSVDTHFKLIAFNQAFENAYRLVRGIAPYPGMNILEYLPSETQAQTAEDYRRVFAGEQLRHQTVYRFPDGDRWMDVHYNPIHDHSGDVTGAAVFNRDITSQRYTEFELIRSKERAEEMNRLKSSFLANMSHEIRTPVTSILGFASLIVEEAQDEDLRMYAETISRSGGRLLETINSILDLAKVEANTTEYHPAPVDLIAEVEAAVQLIRPTVIRKQLALSLTKQEARLLVTAEAQYLGQILLNLLGNASKFTLEGGIAVQVLREGSYGCVLVTDTGVGIADDFLPRIFDEFKQESSGYERKFEGSGLGLTISKRLAEMMGGLLDVQSKKGYGSTFRLRLPIAQEIAMSEPTPESSTPAITPPSPLPEPAQTPRILLVEDTFETGEMIKLFLRGAGELQHATDAQTALALTAEQDFDVILMDINLGRGMSGLDVTRQLREDPRFAATPIVALTAYAMKGDREQMLEAGCTDYLSKPFSRSELLTLLGKYITIARRS